MHTVYSIHVCRTVYSGFVWLPEHDAVNTSGVFVISDDVSSSHDDSMDPVTLKSGGLTEVKAKLHDKNIISKIEEKVMKLAEEHKQVDEPGAQAQEQVPADAGSKQVPADAGSKPVVTVGETQQSQLAECSDPKPAAAVTPQLSASQLSPNDTADKPGDAAGEGKESDESPTADVSRPHSAGDAPDKVVSTAAAGDAAAAKATEPQLSVTPAAAATTAGSAGTTAGSAVSDSTDTAAVKQTASSKNALLAKVVESCKEKLGISHEVLTYDYKYLIVHVPCM